MKALTTLLLLSIFAVSCASSTPAGCKCGDSCAKTKSSEQKNCCGECGDSCAKKKS